MYPKKIILHPTQTLMLLYYYITDYCYLYVSLVLHMKLADQSILMELVHVVSLPVQWTAIHPRSQSMMNTCSRMGGVYKSP